MNRKIQVLLWVLTAAWMGLIFYFSAQTAQVSTGQSGGLIRWVLGLLDPAFESLAESVQTARIELLQHTVRKLAHMSVYAVLGALCMSALYTHSLRVRVRPVIAFAITVLYAVTDELHQTFVPGRSGELRDVLIDSVGALLGILLVFLIWKLIIRQKRIGSER